MIRFENGIFALEAEHSGYYMGLRGELVETLHFGGRLRPTAGALAEKHAVVYGSAIPYAGADDLLHLCLELSPTDKGDYRRTGLELRLADGSSVVNLYFSRNSYTLTYYKWKCLHTHTNACCSLQHIHNQTAEH